MSTAKKVLFSVVPAVAIWGLLELGVSAVFSTDLLGWSAPPPTAGGQTPTMPGNPYLLYEYRPGRHLQADVLTTINTMGMRGEETTIPKPDGVRRLMTTGDSSIFGFGVQDNEVFSEVIAAALGDNVEAINAATPGYSSYQTINLLRLRALTTEPDLIIVGNLWSDNNFDAFVDKDLLASYEGYATSIVGKTRALLSTSAIFRVMDYRMRVQPAAERVGFGDTDRILDQGSHIGFRRVEINDYATNLQQIVDLASSVDADTIFMVPANNEDMRSSDGNMKAWDPYRDVMRAIASRNGAHLIEVPELFLSSGESADQLFIDEMHPSAVGHNLIAQELIAFLKDKQWADGGSVMHSGTGGPMERFVDPFLAGSSSEFANGTLPEPILEPNASPQPSDGGDPGPNSGGGRPSLGPTLQGDLSFSEYKSGIILIEAFDASEAGQTPIVLGQDRLMKPGPFRVEIGDATKVVFRAYLDEDSDGPDADDRLIDMTSTIINVSEAADATLLVNIDDELIEVQ